MSTSISSLTPYFIVKNARTAIDFYGRAFGAEELFRMTDPRDGRIGHAELKIGESTVMIADEYPDFGALSPDTIGGSPVTFHLAT
ncbi:VOC family protein, partial [Ensifer sp. IC3342]|nr:VOC family protein [Ensifer sp. BRP08]MCA1451558.1 VOC family protein [Ensifer sp. IC3342]